MFSTWEIKGKAGKDRFSQDLWKPLWGGRFERSYMDVRVFKTLSPLQYYSLLQEARKRKETCLRTTGKGDRACVVHTTCVFSNRRYGSTGNNSLKKACKSLLADKWDQPYSTTMSWMRCRLSFSLLTSAILCIRGARSSIGHAIRSPPLIDLVLMESWVSGIVH